MAFCSLPGWRRAADTLRWESADRVAMFPLVDQLGRTLGPTELLVDGGIAEIAEIAAQPADTHGDETQAWDVVVRRDPREEPAGPRITVIGGGPMNGVPDAYDRALRDRLCQMTQPPWVTWWAPADTDELELWYDFDPARSAPDVRRMPGRVRATVRRAAGEMRAGPLGSHAYGHARRRGVSAPRVVETGRDSPSRGVTRTSSRVLSCSA